MWYNGQIRFLGFAALFPVFLVFNAAATTYYVDINNPNPVPPYTSWATAATNIQDAINAAVNGNLIMVNPGVYQNGGETVNGYGLTNRVAITAPLIVESTEGPTNTIIQGYQVPGAPNGSNAVRCVYMTNNAVLIGFTLRGGATLGSGDTAHEESGGGVWCESSNATLMNCVIVGNDANYAGGGAAQGTLQYCTVSQNNVYGGSSFGGGAYESSLANCTVASNSVYCTGQALGGGVYGCSVTNSAIADNSAYSFNLTSEGGGAYGGNLVNCNITGNFAAQGGGTYSANLINCINYFNNLYTNSTSDLGLSNYWGEGTITYSCTFPDPRNAGDITNDPQLASLSHISLGSPCRGAGTASATSGVDIDSNPWGNPPSMGCFEPHPGNVLGILSVGISAPTTNWAAGFGLNLEANISGPVYSNVWNFGDGTYATNEVYLFHTWSAIGTYPVTLTAYNDSYPAGVTTTLVINVSVPGTYYVNLNNRNPLPPYISWDTAAVNIQDAVNVAAPGSVVLVTNGPTIPSAQTGNYTNSAAVCRSFGSYAPNGYSYTLVVTNPVTVESVTGPASTYISGTTYQGGEVGCVYLTNGAALSGFTLTNGFGFGGGIWAASTNAFVTNCIVTKSGGASGAVNFGTCLNCLIENNQASGAYMSVLNNCTLNGNGPAADECVLNNCVITNNSGGASGGILNNCLIVSNARTAAGWAGAYAAQGYPIVLNNCLISNNVALEGGGVYNSVTTSTPEYYTNCVLNNCILVGNSAAVYGGGASGAELNNCLISSNKASSSGGGGGAQAGVLNNCLIVGNSGGGVSGFLAPAVLNNCTLSQNSAQSGGGALDSILNDCLIISNSATARGGGASGCSLTNCILAGNAAAQYGGGAYQSALVNCTVTSNSAPTGGGIYQSTADDSILYNNSGGNFAINTTAYPLNYCCTPQIVTNGLRNITNAPLFVSAAENNFHLQANSPCINSGNNSYITTTAADFDGNSRIAGGTVDIGAYEYQTPTSVISYAYLQQYGLPTDGSVDFKDLDGTAFNVYQDWVAGLNPTNSASVLAMLTPGIATNAAGVTVSWQSVNGILYNLQRSTNLTAQLPFMTVQTNITGHAGNTSYTDGAATNGIPYFYRVSVVAP